MTTKIDISFTTSREDMELIFAIVDRAEGMEREAGRTLDKRSLAMDVTAVHCNGCPLRLREFLEADDFNFAHDYLGIMRHMHRKIGRLGGHFLPRFSKGLT